MLKMFDQQTVPQEGEKVAHTTGANCADHS